MDSARLPGPKNLLTLAETAQQLGVSVDTLLLWNEYQILKPTITHEGTIGYTQEQVAQFLLIQQSFKQQGAQSVSTQTQNTLPLASLEQTTLHSLPSSAKNTPEQNSSNQDFRSVASKGTPLTTEYWQPIILFSGLSVISALLAIVVLTQQAHIKTLVNDAVASLEYTSSSQTSSMALNQHLPVAMSSQTKTINPNGIEKNSQSNESIFAKQPTNPTPTIQIASRKTGSADTSKVLATKTIYPQHSTPISNDQTTEVINNTTTFASVLNTDTKTKSTNSPFDAHGNLTGKVSQQDILAMNTGFLGDTPSVSLTGNNLRNQLILVAMGCLTFALYLLKKPRAKAIVTTSPVILASEIPEKILEVDQRMDGTVILTFKGKDYKISKPEMDSDSDQFIARLMKLVPQNAKEIEYDSFEDDKLSFATPLSRLVTRLGFVGVKRDLFFPRTSKNRVLFRKYITQEDLDGLHISPDQLFSELGPAI